MLRGETRPIKLRELSMITGQCRWRGTPRHRNHCAGFEGKSDGSVVRWIHKVLTLRVRSKRTLFPPVSRYERMTVTTIVAALVIVKPVT